MALPNQNTGMNGLPASVNRELMEASERLERDYTPAFNQRRATIGTYWNRKSLNIEVTPWAGVRGWTAHAAFARLTWWPFGKWIQTKSISEAESQLREEVDAFLKRGVPP